MARPEIPLEVLRRHFHRIKVSKKPNGCWLWPTGMLNGKGYGNINITSRGTYLAHRVSYAVHAGFLPASLLVCHTCDVPRCVNPAHLFLGTPRDNTADRVAKGRGTKTKRPHLPADRAQELLDRYRAGERLATLAEEYGVDIGTVANIGKRRTRKELVERGEPRSRKTGRLCVQLTVEDAQAVLEGLRSGVISEELVSRIETSLATIYSIKDKMIRLDLER